MNQGQNQDTFTLFPHRLSYFKCYLQQIYPGNFVLQQQAIENQENQFDYFRDLFSTKKMTESLQKKNEDLQMHNLDNSNSQPEEILHKRNQKMSKLKIKEETQLNDLILLKKENFTKFQAIVMFMKFLCEIKNRHEQIRIDYYSTKTFSALKKSTEKELTQLTHTFKRIYSKIFQKNQKAQDGFQEIILEFLILPRFIISKDKLIRFNKDQELQNNFILLIQNQCLGHYNNESNKKMPQEKHMKFIKQLLAKPKGKQIYKKICTINHGNNFLKKHGNLYYELFYQTLENLKTMEIQMKKNGKSYNVEELLSKSLTEESQICSSSQESTSNNKFSFKSMKSALNKMENENEEEISVSPLKKINSIPLEDSESFSKNFKVKKSLTFEPNKRANILLVQPSDKYFEI